MTMRWRWLFSLVATCALTAAAAPFEPAADSEVLERLPVRGTADRGLARLRAAASADRTDAAAAVALADAYYRIARDEGDPRFLSYAQAALAPWWRDPEAPTPVLVTRATIRQSQHEFDQALADLDRALARDPRGARARLVRSTVLAVQGRHAEARADCAKLPGLVAEFYVFACVASIDGQAGRAESARATLARALAALPAGDAAGRAWGESLLGELAHRRGDAAAGTHFRAALAADPEDLYTRAAYADWLLDAGRAADALALVAPHARTDALLLRKAIAQQRLGHPDAAATAAALRARFAASRLRGDTVHRREEARFALAVERDPAAALSLARANWRVQREPADLRVLAEAAVAAGDAQAQAMARRWLAETGLEYAAVAATLAEARR